jgi:hypothetical protein
VIEEGFNRRAGVSPAPMALAEQRLLIQTGLSQLFGGVVVEVRNALNALGINAAEAALGSAKARGTVMLHVGCWHVAEAQLCLRAVCSSSSS